MFPWLSTFKNGDFLNSIEYEDVILDVWKSKIIYKCLFWFYKRKMKAVFTTPSTFMWDKVQIELTLFDRKHSLFDRRQYLEGYYLILSFRLCDSICAVCFIGYVNHLMLNTSQLTRWLVFCMLFLWLIVNYKVTTAKLKSPVLQSMGAKTWSMRLLLTITHKCIVDWYSHSSTDREYRLRISHKTTEARA